MWAWALLPILAALWLITGIWAVTCGAFPPQSCIFAQILNVGALCVVWISLIRYQQIKDYGCHSRINTASLILGCISALGISIVGNFQQTNQLETHLLGAFLAFYVGIAYFWLQVVLSFKVRPRHGGLWVMVVRIILCAICTVCEILMIVFHRVHMRTPAAILEWAAAMCLFLLFPMFVVDFRHVDGHFYHVQKQGPKLHTEMHISTQTLAL
nr:PREDICTED: transmembrane protein 150B isoform X2 [Latimeria chalumnae]|eukprot:XP_014342948.1 PREDICTED: transmembrane protein 150B isoform X2 [Latimeria chalumnae]